MKNRGIVALLLALSMVFGLCACGFLSETPTESPGETQQPTQSPSSGETETPPVNGEPGTEPSDEPTEEPTAEPSEDLEPSVEPTEEPVEDVVRLAVLAGSAGIGAVKLFSDSDAGLTVNHYACTVVADDSEMIAGLVSGEPALDIAAVSSNVALSLYNDTDGGVKIIALGPLGGLHILEGSGGTMVESVADLEGETIYCAGQGSDPEYVLRHLLIQNELDPDLDVEIIFAPADEIQAKLLSGEIGYAVLPVLAATEVVAQSGGQVRCAIDVAEIWDRMGSGSQLIMTAVVARTEFIKENPQVVVDFLKEYAAAIDYASRNADAAAKLAAGYGIAADAAVAKLAISQCRLSCITGRSMSATISDYFRVLYGVSPASVGGRLPDDAIYYIP